MADDCKGQISEWMAEKLGVDRLRVLHFYWEFEALQPNGSHFSYELKGTLGVAVIHIACFTCVLLVMAVYQVMEMKRSGRIHVMVQMLNICVLSQMSSSLLHVAHLLAYRYNGKGIPFLDGVAETMAVVSQIVMSSVMIFISFGYTLNVPSAPSHVESIAAPITVIVIIFHVVLVRPNNVPHS